MTEGKGKRKGKRVGKGQDEGEDSMRERVREAARDPSARRLREETHDEKGRPEAVNLERDEPITTAARRRDEF